MSDLQVTVDGVSLTATWTGENEGVRAALADVLPVAGDATRWGDELFFDVPIDVDPARTRESVPVGAVAYWPAGDTLCLFWGPTPASSGDEPRAAAPVAVVARLDEPSSLERIDGGARVTVEYA